MAAQGLAAEDLFTKVAPGAIEVAASGGRAEIELGTERVAGGREASAELAEEGGAVAPIEAEEAHGQEEEEEDH